MRRAVAARRWMAGGDITRPASIGEPDGPAADWRCFHRHAAPDGSRRRDKAPEALDGSTVFLPIRANRWAAATPVCCFRGGVRDAIGRCGMFSPPRRFTAAVFMFVKIILAPDSDCPCGRVAGMTAPWRAMSGFFMRTMRPAPVYCEQSASA